MWWDHGMGGTVETGGLGRPARGPAADDGLCGWPPLLQLHHGASRPHCGLFCISSHCPGLGLPSMPLFFTAPAPSTACLQRRGFGENSEATQEVGADCQSFSRE